MKKWLACFMSVVMLFASFPVSILAEEAGQEPSAQITENNTVTENQEVDKTAESVEEASSEAVESSEPQPEKKEAGALYAGASVDLVGNIEVEIHFSQPRTKLSETAVLTLAASDGTSKEIPLKDVISEKATTDFGSRSIQYKTLLFDRDSNEMDSSSVLYNEQKPDAKIYFANVNFYSLPIGDYTVTVSDKGMVPAQAQVSLQGSSKRVEFMGGSILTGDVDQNGSIDDADYDAVMKSLGSSEADCDLNGDGTVDIVDLVYLQENMGVSHDSGKVQISDTSPIVDPGNVTFEKDKTDPVTIKSGDIAKLFSTASDQAGAVQFAREDGSTISEDTPLRIPLLMKEPVIATELRIAPSELGLENAPKRGTIEVTDEQDNIKSVDFDLQGQADYLFLTDEASPSTIVIDLKGQVAIKKVTIIVKETNKASSNLAEISKVEFLNNTKDKIVEQVTSIPTNVQVASGNESLTVSWEAQSNVTGYEVKMSYTDPKSGKAETVLTPVDGTSLTISDLTNFVEYKISVQSVNRSEGGNWESGFSAPVIGIPLPTSVPEQPEGITLKGGYRQITVNWEKQKNSTEYNVYYREKGNGEYTKAGNLENTSYVIENLKDQAEYEVYLTGYNAIGEGARSSVYTCTTESIEPPVTSNYKLINRAGEVNQPTAHIKDVTYPYLKESDYEQAYDKFDIVDNDYTSYWNYGGWNAGGWSGKLQAPVVEFDQSYEMNDIVLVRGEGEPSTYNAYMKIRWWDEAGQAHDLNIGKDFAVQAKKSTNGKEYYRIRINEKIKPVKIQMNPALYWAGAPNARCRISEIKFYAYDSLADETNALFMDDLHVELRDSVTMEIVDKLIERANTPDTVSGEFHPDKDSILSELILAKAILSETNIDDTVLVDQNVSNAKNGNLGFAMALNDFQPLGLAAKAGDTINVYVGTEGNVLPQLVYTQYHPDVKTGWSKTVNLKKGKNEITLEQIGGEDSERGGALYIRYPNASPSGKDIKVRVAGATKIPYLNLTGITDENDAKTAIQSYIKELKAFVAKVPDMYAGEESKHQWDKKSSIYNSTDIMTNQMLLSVPATAVFEALNGSESEQIEQLYQNSLAMEQLMDITYNSKGLSRDAENAKDKWPGSRINIRYTRMFTGAFMYATGQHIGIEYGSVGGLTHGRPHTKQADGTMGGGNLYGWGIAHEIGHVTDEGDMVYGETSNNILSQLVKTFDEKAEARADYPAIYQKVTSGTKGYASNVFTQLGMFWQLHLAYDDTYNNLDDPDSFYGRLYQNYRRNTMKTDKDNLLIRMASDTAKKDLTAYFEKWGLTPNEETIEYVSKYPKEERAIYYLNDDARHKRIEKAPAMAKNTKVEATLNHTVENGKDSKKITFNLGVNKNSEAILGYEIIRNGEVVGFTTGNSYTDVISSMNNRVLKYEVVAYDNYLNKTEALALEPIKIQHDGSIAKTKWTMDTDMTSEGDEYIEDCTGSGLSHPALAKLYDNDYGSIYEGTKTTNNPQITINLHENMPVVGFKYTAAVKDGAFVENTIKNYTIQVSEDGVKWQDAAKGSFAMTTEKPEATVYFNEKDQDGANQLITYRAEYVRIIANGAAGVSAAEFDIIGPPGDNVELEQNGIGLLEEDFVYDPDQPAIKAGSLIFTGSYRGHPGFNAVLLKDQDGNNVVGKDNEAASIFMANIPENGNIGEISQGTWIYWIDKDQLDMKKLPGTVKVELYRVNNMETNEGQRLTSDTFDVELPDSLPNIRLTGEQIPEE